MKGVRAVIFDVYNTLFHNEHSLWQETFKEICAAQNLGVDPLLLWQKWRARESGFRLERVTLADPEVSPPFRSYETVWRDCFAATFQELGLTTGDPDSAVAAAIQALARREPYPEALETVQSLDGAMTLGVLSNADVAFIYPLLESHKLPFKAIVTSEEARAYKPHPRPFQMILEMLGVAPHEAIMVGDTLHEDVLGAQRAGMKAVWVNRQKSSPTAGQPAPDQEIEDLRQLLALVKGR